MSTLCRAPGRAVVGQAAPARVRRPARHRRGALHRRPRRAHAGRAARPPGAGTPRARPGHRPAHGTRPRRARGRARAHRRRRAGRQRRRAAKHDEPLFPTEVMFHGHAVCWVLGETLEAARLGSLAVEVDYEPLPAVVTVREAIAADSFQGGRPLAGARRRRRGLRTAPRVFSGELDLAGQEHFYLETHCSLAQVDEAGQVFVQCSTQHPTETQDDRRPRARRAQPRGHRAVPADGRWVRRQGDAAARVRRRRRAGGPAHRPPGAAAAHPRPGHDDDGQAARLPRPVAGGLRRRRPAAGARRDPHLRRRLEPRPVRAGARPRPVPRRQRLLDPRTCA